MLFDIKKTLSISLVASLEKWSFRSPTTVAEGRFPTHSACPDCFGFRGGPLGVEGILAELEFELPLLFTARTVNNVLVVSKTSSDLTVGWNEDVARNCCKNKALKRPANILLDKVCQPYLHLAYHTLELLL